MNYGKLAPGLALALKTYRQEGPPGLRRHVRSLGVIAKTDKVSPPRLPVFIFCDREAELAGVEEYGVQVNRHRGRVRTAFLSLEAIERLSEHPEVQRISPSRFLRPMMDAASTRCRLPDFRNRVSLTGRGVLIGVVDTGIDPLHSAFSGRIHRIWDQTLPGSGVNEGFYGRELGGLQLTKSVDTEGHGTHVTGIAAGADSVFGGIAPEATLAVVKTDFDSVHIADAIRYLFRLGADLGMPVIVNLSLGGHDDPHDGSDPLSATIDEVSGPGRIVCCSAGNEGNDNIHAQVTIPPGGEKSIRFRIPPDAVEEAWLTGWYPGASALEVAVGTPAGFFTPFQAIVPSGQDPTERYDLPEAIVSVATPDIDPNNGDHNFRVHLSSPSGGTLKGGAWRLVLRNTSSTATRLDVWALDGMEIPVVLFSGTSVNDSVKIGSPGSAASAITVASFNTKVQWTDIDGIARQVGLTLDDISDFSSEGPLRNGARKPDFAAPGAMIVSCLSSDSQQGRELMVSQDFVLMMGTSMATPFVTGLGALLFQRDPALDPSKMKSLLAAQCSIPNNPAGTFHPKWGMGLIDTFSL